MMDPKVLEAQRWVNKTYGSVSGYTRCPEDGRVGWSTMFSLVMGLQAELGITQVVANFGPGTVARFDALGDIAEGWKGKKNIIQILQHGLFCKGCWGANNYGEFDRTTTAAIIKLRENMGLSSGGLNSGIINTSIARCILNMDAYVLLAGGTEKIRRIQQWLNGRYWLKSAYSIGPCDGIYSRDVQKSLLIALQYELGLAAPNGNFGSGTQAALRQRVLRPGDSGVFVQLFSAACVFNEPIPIGFPLAQGEVRTEQRTNFDAKLVEYVRLFQDFSQLSVTGIGDYQTWAQLLVSMGDPYRPATGCDTRFQITSSRARWLKNNGYQAVARYIYDPGTGLDKDIKPGELEIIFSQGLRVMPIFQDNARRLEDF